MMEKIRVINSYLEFHDNKHIIYELTINVRILFISKTKQILE